MTVFYYNYPHILIIQMQFQEHILSIYVHKNPYATIKIRRHIVLFRTLELQTYGVLSIRVSMPLYIYDKNSSVGIIKETQTYFPYFMLKREIIITTSPQFFGMLWMPPKHVSVGFILCHDSCPWGAHITWENIFILMLVIV